MTQGPDLKLAGLSIWILGREFPDHPDFWDGNWLRVRIRVSSPGAKVEVDGPLVRTDEISAFADELEHLDRTLVGIAALRCMEPNLRVVIEGDILGHAKVTVQITPDHTMQFHKFIFSTDQTEYKPLLGACRKIVERYNVRGTPSELPSGLKSK